MRFNKGDKVEVLSQMEVPSGSWRCGEIICGKGHNYTVRYDGDAASTDEPVLERLSTKAIRPCPPSLDVSEYWVPGDVVEVFNNYSWKMATISKILGKMYFLVRLLGSSLEFKVSKFDIRVRQSWQDNKWVVIGEGCEDGNYYKNLTLKYCQNSSFQIKKSNTRLNFHIKDEGFPAKNKMNIQGSLIASSRTLKRGFPYYSKVEGTGAVEKFRAIDRDGRLHRVIAANQSLLPEQVDAVAFPRETLGENNLHPFLNDGMTGFSDVEAEWKRSTGAVGCSSAMNLDSNDAHSVACSVGSCSISSNKYNSYKLPRHVSAGPMEDSEGNFSDAESFCQLGYEEGNCHLPTKEDVAAEIHRLELHAYRCTMEALHASGPLRAKVGVLHTSLPNVRR